MSRYGAGLYGAIGAARNEYDFGGSHLSVKSEGAELTSLFGQQGARQYGAGQQSTVQYGAGQYGAAHNRSSTGFSERAVVNFPTMSEAAVFQSSYGRAVKTLETARLFFLNMFGSSFPIHLQMTFCFIIRLLLILEPVREYQDSAGGSRASDESTDVYSDATEQLQDLSSSIMNTVVRAVHKGLRFMHPTDVEGMTSALWIIENSDPEDIKALENRLRSVLVADRERVSQISHDGEYEVIDGFHVGHFRVDRSVEIASHYWECVVAANQDKLDLFNQFQSLERDAVKLRTLLAVPESGGLSWVPPEKLVSYLFG